MWIQRFFVFDAGWLFWVVYGLRFVVVVSRRVWFQCGVSVLGCFCFFGIVDDIVVNVIIVVVVVVAAAVVFIIVVVVVFVVIVIVVVLL